MTSENAPAGNTPSATDDFVAKGWTNHVNGEHADSEANFRKALEINAQSAEAYYGLAMALKSQNQLKAALDAFEKVTALINSNQMAENPARATMLRNLAEIQIENIRKQIGAIS